MAATVLRLPARGNRKYPWERWSNGAFWKATQGIDFDCSPFQFRRNVHTRANRDGLKAESRIEGKSVAFRIYKPKRKRK